jgi:hypothetical protein
VCAYSLDHITPSRLRAIVSQIVTTIKLNKDSLAWESRLSLYDTS